MKKVLIYLAGIATGVVLTLLVAFVIYKTYGDTKTETVTGTTTETVINNEEDNGITMFKEPGDIIRGKSFKVFQVLEQGAALVNGASEYDMYLGPVYLLVNKDGKYYYDDEIINVPKGKVVRQMGVFQYLARNEMTKTVPIIMIMDK